MSLNGFAFVAKPGVEIDIPRPVRLMLDTRIRTESVKNADGDIITRDIPRVTYTLIKENVDTVVPTPEIIVAQQEQEQEQGQETEFP